MEETHSPPDSSTLSAPERSRLETTWTDGLNRFACHHRSWTTLRRRQRARAVAARVWMGGDLFRLAGKEDCADCRIAASQALVSLVCLCLLLQLQHLASSLEDVHFIVRGKLGPSHCERATRLRGGVGAHGNWALRRF